jgi:hypothetical protein
VRQALRSPIKTIVEGYSYWRENGARLKRTSALCQCADAMRIRRVRDFEARSLGLYRRVRRSLDAWVPPGPGGASDVAVAAHRALWSAKRPYRAVAAASLVVAVALVALGFAALALGSIFSTDLGARFFPRDLAAKRPWVAVNNTPGYPSSGIGPSTEGPALFHTTHMDRPWIEIDLGSEHTISGFLIENRADCCKERALPLNFEVFQRGEWRLLAQRRTPFDTWSIDLAPVRAARVRVLRPGQDFLHLKRISVYGR